MKTTVLDASALLAMLFGQQGVEQMRELFHKASEADKPMFMSAVNWAEVVYKLEHKRGAEGRATAYRFAHTMPLVVEPVDRELAETAAVLKIRYNLGLADAFAASLALKFKKAELVAADKEFAAVEKEVKIIWLR